MCSGGGGSYQGWSGVNQWLEGRGGGGVNLHIRSVGGHILPVFIITCLNRIVELHRGQNLHFCKSVILTNIKKYDKIKHQKIFERSQKEVILINSRHLTVLSRNNKGNFLFLKSLYIYFSV